MLENLNLSLFSLINATPDSAPWMISLAIFIAKDLITVVAAAGRGTLVVGAYSTTATGDKNRYRAGGQPVCVWTMGHLFSARPTLCRKYRL